MKIIITGGAGFIGSHVADLYIAAGHQVVIIDNLSTGSAENIHSEAKFYREDISSPHVAEIFDIEKPDVVNHHAAQMNVRRSIADPLFDAQVNIIGSLNLIQNAIRTNVKHFIYISSGGAAYGEPEYLPCDEHHPVNPICPYGVSKHTVEHYLYLYHQMNHLPYTVFRYPNVYGPRQDPLGEAGVIAIFCGQMLRDEPVYINDDGNQERDFVFIDDIASANLKALHRNQGCGIVNLGSGKGTSVNTLFDHLKKMTGYSREAIYRPAIKGEVRKIFLNYAKAQFELGWYPRVTLQEGLQRTVEYHREKMSQSIFEPLKI